MVVFDCLVVLYGLFGFRVCLFKMCMFVYDFCCVFVIFVLYRDRCPNVTMYICIHVCVFLFYCVFRCVLSPVCGCLRDVCV